MGEERFELRHGSLSPDDIAGRFVVEKETRRLLAGVGHNAHRSWVFPLNTPRGLNVVQEYPFDHPFHNGVFVGQAKVVVGGREAHFWAPAPDWRSPNNHIYHDIGLLKYDRDTPASVALEQDGACFQYKTQWMDEHSEPMLNEVRTITIRSDEDGTICDVTTAKTATYGDIHYRANKHGTIGARVQPQLLPFLGGCILGGFGNEIRAGDESTINGTNAGFVAYEADVPGFGPFGICLIVRENSAADHLQGPWFVRNYGMAMFNATMVDEIRTSCGETWTASLRVVAYDGPLTFDRVCKWRTN